MAAETPSILLPDFYLFGMMFPAASIVTMTFATIQRMTGEPVWRSRWAINSRSNSLAGAVNVARVCRTSKAGMPSSCHRGSSQTVGREPPHGEHQLAACDRVLQPRAAVTERPPG
jgi:hypothetical protein